MNVVKILGTFVEGGRRIVKLLRFGRDDVQTSKQVTPYGFECNPVSDTVGLYTTTSSRNRTYVVGYISESNETEPGECRVFSTNAAGDVQIAFHYKADGTVEMGGKADNAVRYSKLKEAFDDLKSDFNNLVNNYNAHTHPVVSIGSPTGPAAPLGSPSAADITAAKIDELKTS